ncbi:MAG: hypothetical protein AAGU01_03580, partial [Clostridiaceae bacterium]
MKEKQSANLEEEAKRTKPMPRGATYENSNGIIYKLEDAKPTDINKWKKRKRISMIIAFLIVILIVVLIAMA